MSDLSNMELALSVSIAIIIVLLLSCWKSKHPKKRLSDNDSQKSACALKPSSQKLAGPKPSSQNRIEGAQDPNVAQRLSDTGRGVVNRSEAARLKQLKNLKGYDDYNSLMQYMALEPEVFESQQQYSEDMNRFSLGPSDLAERSDPNDVVNWVGLRRPDYSAVYADSTARVEHSDIPDQMYKKTQFLI